MMGAMAMKRWFRAMIAACGAIPMVAGLGVAQPMTTGGITFSDSGGGFTIVAVSGSGSSDDPFIVVEEIYAIGTLAMLSALKETSRS